MKRRIDRRPLRLEELESREVPATFTVTTLADAGAGSLRQAILDANNEGVNPGSDTIVFGGAAIGGTVSLLTRGGTQFGPNALEVTSTIVINGSGETIRRDAGAPNFRLFFISTTGNLTVNDLTLSGGVARGGDGGTNAGDDGGGGGGGMGAGGAIYNRGTLTVGRSLFTANTAQGGNGGAGADNSGTDAGGGGGGGGMGGNGGTTPNDNTNGGAGGGGFFGNGVGGAVAVGGGGGGSTTNASGSTGGTANGGAGGAANVNGTVGGLGGGGGGGGDEANGGAGGIGGGGGGGGENDDATDNGAGGGGYGGGGGGGGEDGAGAGGGYGGGGGGGSNEGAAARAGGAGGFNAGAGGSSLATRGSGGGGGGAGTGGAIFNDAGTITIRDSTFSGNTAIGGLGGAAGGTAAAGTNGLGTGGAILNRNGTLNVRSSTLTNNAANFGRGINNVGDGATATVTLNNSILGQAANVASDYDSVAFGGGAIVSSGVGNLIRINGGFAGSIVSAANPLLGALADNGGPTFTHLPGVGSPAINAGVNNQTIAIIDQRGFAPRIFGGSIDIGSVEVGATLPPLAVGGSLDGRATTLLPDAAGAFGGPVATPAGLFPGFAGGARVAAGDVNADGFHDTILVTGPGTAIRVAVISGADNSTALVAPFDPFGGNFGGGGFVAAADLDGDGRAEFVVTPDEGGGPRVSVFSLLANGTVQTKANFLGIDDDAFRGGARPALGDVDADGFPDLLVAAGFGGGPRVALFDGGTLFSGRTKLGGDFFAFPDDASTLRNGIFAALGDIDGDSFADLVFGGGPGGAPRVYILSGEFLMSGNANLFSQPLANFFVAGNSADRGGVRLAVKNADGDARADLVVGSGEGSPAKVRVYLGSNFTGTGEPSTFQDLDVFGGATLPGGVFVG